MRNRGKRLPADGLQLIMPSLHPRLSCWGSDARREPSRTRTASRRALRQRDASLLFVSHDLRVVGKICEKVGVMYGGVLMEFGTSNDIFVSPRHPYTQRLLECARIDEDDELKSIPGSVPKLDRIHSLCPFRNRCNRKLEVCDHEMPPITLLDNSHISRCHHN